MNNELLQLDLNVILQRQMIVSAIRELLTNYNQKCKDINFKKGIYIYGSPGSGKTHFVTNLLKSIGYDVIKYDAGDVRNKSLIDTITSNNVASCNVLDLLVGRVKQIAIVMDEIDGMNNGDKGGITSLIKLIRQKKTKKQKTENTSNAPIICIGNYFADKKINELRKVCHVFELPSPTTPQMQTIINTIMPSVAQSELRSDILNYIQCDLRKLSFIHSIYLRKPNTLTRETIHNIFHIKSYHDDAKNIVKTLFQRNVPLEEHNMLMNETDRTTVALLWHENVVDFLTNVPKPIAIPFYLKILNNICFADYIDRITFQSQIWIFNEMSSLMKTFYNNRLFHNHMANYLKKTLHQSGDDIRFTKVLTKYRTEYDNLRFVYMLCQELDMDRKDIIVFFQELRLYYGVDFTKSEKMAEVEKLFVDTNISKLDIQRVYRYLDKNVKKEQLITSLEEELDDDIGV